MLFFLVVVVVPVVYLVLVVEQSGPGASDQLEDVLSIIPTNYYDCDCDCDCDCDYIFK